MVKSVPHLTYKTVFPSSFEREIVMFVVKIFNEITVSILNKHQIVVTHFCVYIVLTWWWIKNVKRPLTYIVIRNPLKMIFYNATDDRFIFLDTFLASKSMWKKIDTQNFSGCLILYTFNALYHTTFAIKELQ